MQWLTPTAGLIGAAVTIPALLLLYFLKLRRRQVAVSSTFLWKRAVQDLQVNAPFQRLRRNILLLLQMLALAAVLVAMGRPVLRLQEGPGQRYVLLIDRSASMNALDGQLTRLDLAQAGAREVVDSLRGQGAFDLGGQSDQAMVIAFDDRVKVMCNFTSDKEKLRSAVDAIEAGDGDSALVEAVQVARAYAQPPAEDANGRSAEPAAGLELFSDGQIHDLADVVVREGELRFHCIGESSDNVAIVAMAARRSYERPEEVTVFAALANYGPEPIDCDVQLSLDWNVLAVRKARLGPRTPAGAGSPGGPGSASVTFTMSHAGAGVIEVRQLRRDMLAADDAAWAVLPAPKRLKALLVSPGNLALSQALASCSLAGLDRLTPAQFDSAEPASLQDYDMIVLDRHAPAKLPRGRYLTFGPPPPDMGGQVQDAGEFIVDWSARHPVLEYVDLAKVFAAKHYKLTLDRTARVLAEFSDSPAIALVSKAGSTFVVVGFDVNESNWPFEPGFVMFCYNVANFLGGAAAGGDGAGSLKVHQAITVRGPQPNSQARLIGPGGARSELVADASGVFNYGQTNRVGVYSVSVGDRDRERFAVNLLDAGESDISPVREIELSGQPVQAVAAAPQRRNREVWPWLIAVAMALVCLEWVVYNSKVRI
ncbi:MAG: VWA domain-containing protein [Planctomycetes bacterium]|nr:VWA domain-containing protein [Planctomycetota bacterium]